MIMPSEEGLKHKVATAEFTSRTYRAQQHQAQQQQASTSTTNVGPVFPQGPRLRPSVSNNAFTEFCQYGGRRIIVLYLMLAIMLYMRAFRYSTQAQQAAAVQVPVSLSSKDVCKGIHFVRHGEALHNRDAKLYEDFYQGRHLSPIYHDARLTEIGIDQARKLSELISQRSFAPELVVSSTLTRAIQTAKGAFPGASRVLATDLCRERIAAYASDRRRSVTEVSQEFPDVDFSLVLDEHDIHFESRKEIHPDPYDSDACKERARRFVDWLLHERPEKNIVVVTHWVFLSHLLRAEQVMDQRVFENAEMRAIKLCRTLD